MKQLRKSATLLRNQEAQVRAERDILKRAEGTRWANRQ